MEEIEHRSRAQAFSEYPSRQSQEWMNMYSPSSGMQHYHSPAGVSYLSPARQMQYSPTTTTYAYTSPYLASSNAQASMYLPSPNSMVPYSVRPPPRSATLPSQHRLLSRNGYYSLSNHHSHLRSPLTLDLAAIETEDQDSVNRDSMKSEALDPPIIGYPKVEDFDELMARLVSIIWHMQC